MTAHLIDMQWQNTLADYCAEEPDFCFSLGQFLGENLSWMRYQIENNPEDAYWHQVFQSSNFKCGCICRRKQTEVSRRPVHLRVVPQNSVNSQFTCAAILGENKHCFCN